MSALTLFLLYAGAMILLYLVAQRLEQRPPTYREVVISITANMEAFQRELGHRLLPAVEQAVAAFNDFEEAFQRVEETLNHEGSQ